MSDVCEHVRDAKSGEWIDIWGDGSYFGTATAKYTYLRHDPMGEVFRHVAWINPPFGPASQPRLAQKEIGVVVYRTRQEMKAHLGDRVNVKECG